MTSAKQLVTAICTAFFILGSCLEASAGEQVRQWPEISGSWSGKLSIGPASLNIVFNFSKDQDGNLTCTMESPDQGSGLFPAMVEIAGTDSIAITVPGISASYSGRLLTDSVSGEITSAKGTFRQNGMVMPLDLKYGKPIIFRPQTPVAPFPYRTEEVTFRNGDALLSGTLTYPVGYSVEKDMKVPAVIMVTGSGQQNRDEEIFSHKPFLVIADYLARNGIASLRYDDRGTGSSTGDPSSVTMQSNFSDAMAGLALLDSLGCFSMTGILGHSEGGTLALMAGAEGKADFVISLAGAAVSGKEILLSQNRTALEQAGTPQAITGDYCTMLEKVLDCRIQMKGQRDTGNAAQAAVKARGIVDSLAGSTGSALPKGALDNLAAVLAQDSPWIDSFISCTPQEFLDGVACPVFAANGSLDTQVDAGQNLGTLRDLLPANPHSVIREYPGLNHLFQHCKSGSPSEYGELIETFSRDLLKDITEWISSLEAGAQAEGMH